MFGEHFTEYFTSHYGEREPTFYPSIGHIYGMVKMEMPETVTCSLCNMQYWLVRKLKRGHCKAQV